MNFSFVIPLPLNKRNVQLYWHLVFLALFEFTIAKLNIYIVRKMRQPHASSFSQYKKKSFYRITNTYPSNVTLDFKLRYVVENQLTILEDIGQWYLRYLRNNVLHVQGLLDNDSKEIVQPNLNNCSSNINLKSVIQKGRAITSNL